MAAGAALLALLASPNLCSKAWIWHQYDRSVRTNTVVGPPGDAAVLRVKGTKKGLALTADVNPRYCFADPTRGAAHAVAEAQRHRPGGTLFGCPHDLNAAARPDALARVGGGNGQARVLAGAGR